MTAETHSSTSDLRPNIVMVMTDQHAARVMGCAGDSFALTPALDALAARGQRFETCYCPSPLCVPSRMAFLTGLEPHQSGVLCNDDYLASDIPTLAHALGAAGYDCQLVGRMHFYGPDQTHGFARPIGDIGPNWPGSGAPDIGALTKGRGNRGPELEHSGAGETSYQAFDLAVADQAEQVLARLVAQREETGRPFFCLISLFCPHPPYIARRDDYDAFAGRLPAPRLPAPNSEHPAMAEWRGAGKVADVSAEAIEKSRTAYYALVKMIDRIAGRAFDMVKDRDDTVSVYASDHGEALGERGLWWKSTMYDESAKVPLIMSGPAFEGGAIDTDICSLMDLSATLLALGGTKLPGHIGHDLRDRERPKACTSSYYGGLMNISLAAQRHRMLRQGQWKLVWFDGHDPMLFDLVADPDELQDLATDPAHSDTLRALSARLLDGWDAAQIAQTQQIKQERVQVVRDWVKTTQPAEPYRWIDPDKQRNRYE